MGWLIGHDKILVPEFKHKQIPTQNLTTYIEPKKQPSMFEKHWVDIFKLTTSFLIALFLFHSFFLIIGMFLNE